MENKIKVYGKAQGWTALGIVDAYLRIHPHATLDDLNKAFPREKFASAKSIDHLFIDMKIFEKEAHENGSERAIADAENLRRIHWYITLENGTDVMFYKIAWGKTSFPLLVEHAKQYGIEVASFEDIGRGKGRGSYEIEYIGGDANNEDSEAEKAAAAPTFKTVKIGSQVWMAENLALTKDRDGNELVLGKDYFYPGNDEKNVEKYGLVYTWSAAMRIAPEGWHLPSDEEWKVMEKTVGMCEKDIDIEGAEVPRGVNIVHKLCYKNQWKIWNEEKEAYVGEYPNESDSNSTGFSALPGADAAYRDGCQDTLSSDNAHFWSSTGKEEFESLLGKTYITAYYRELSIKLGMQRGMGAAGGGISNGFAFSVRLVRNEVGVETDEAQQPYASIFKSIKIGSQIWMSANLALTKDRDGNELVLGQDYKVGPYGLKYNWETAMRIAPRRWHLPTVDEWKQLEEDANNMVFEAIGVKGSAALALSCKNGWKYDKGSIFDNYKERIGIASFNALPADEKCNYTAFWTPNQSPDTSGEKIAYGIVTTATFLMNFSFDKNYFFYIRLVKDEN